MPASPDAGATTELAIIGAGPVGLYAAYYAGFRGIRSTIVDALPFVGGQISTFYAESLLYDVPGFPEIRAADLRDRLEAQALQFDPELLLGTRVTEIEAEKGRVQLHCADAETDSRPPEILEARAVLLTTGIGRFAPQRMPDPDLETWVGRGLVYAPGAPSEYRGRRVLVAGGTALGVQTAVALAEAGAETILIHRREKLAIPEELTSALAGSAVRFLPHQELVALEGTDHVERGRLRDRRDASEQELAVDVVVPCFGFAAHRDTLGGVEISTGEAAIRVDTTMAVRPGIWAAGDAVDYPGKVRVLAADFGEACTAVNNLTTELFPGASVFPGYSSSRAGAARRPK